MPESPQSLPPKNSSDQQKLMEDILKGHITVAQLAELEKQRRMQAQVIGAAAGSPVPRAGQISTRIAVEQIESDVRPTVGQFPRQPTLGPGRATVDRPPASIPGPVNRPSTGERTVTSQGGSNLATKSGVSNRNRSSPGAKGSPSASNAKPTGKKASVPPSTDSGKGAADKSGLVATVSISQQIQRILSSHRGSTTAWILSEVLGPPVALRRENERNF